MENKRSIPFESRKTGTGICLACERAIDNRGSFTCTQCRKSPFCLGHLDREFKVCPGCAAEKWIEFYNSLVRQERNLRGFLTLSQFIFILVAILFVAGRFFRDSIPIFIRGSVFFGSLLLWGGLAIFGMTCCALSLPALRKKIREMDSNIRLQRSYLKYSVH